MGRGGGSRDSNKYSARHIDLTTCKRQAQARCLCRVAVFKPPAAGKLTREC